MKRLFSLLLLTVVATAGLPAPARPRTHWTGRSGGYTWTVTSRDVTGGRAGRASFSLKRLLFGAGLDPEGYTHYASTATPLSLVGPYLSFRRDDYWEGGAHPSGSIGYVTLRADRPGRRVSLTELFPDRQVRDALWSDRVVRKVLAAEKVTTPPATAAALVKRLEWKNFGGEEGSTYGFPDNLLQQFAFHHLEGDRVAVRLCVPWGAELYRFRSTEIGLLLPAPASLREPLRRAAAGREGFLMREAARRFAERKATLVEMDAEPGGRP